MSTKFCKECNNMLYPKEDRKNKKLLFVCQQCNHSEPAALHVVYRNELKKAVSENIMKDVLETYVDDPTLPRTRTAHCPKCGFNEATFFQNPLGTGDSMSLYFVCLNPECKASWKEGGRKA
eukprot:EG_transcript_26985